jgi:hypothetical protein
VADRKWGCPWQVVRLFHNGAVVVNCSHRWEITAYWQASLRHTFNPDTRKSTFDVRINPHFGAERA